MIFTEFYYYMGARNRFQHPSIHECLLLFLSRGIIWGFK